MEERVIVDSSFSAIINVPFERIDTPAWCFSLPDEVGDVRSGSVKRIASAVGEGSICVQFVHRALREISALARQMAAA